jgi:hypothetical protein
MDPNQGTQATVVPIGEEWAAGVRPMPVSQGSRRVRWGIAGAVVLCVAVVTAAGAFVLSGAAGAKSLTAGAAPRNTIAFLELRSDLPGDQHAKLADFMSYFPGFKDRAQFNTGLDELLNKLTGGISPDLTYTSAFKPWMEGEVSIAVTGLGSLYTTASSTPVDQMSVMSGTSYVPIAPMVGSTATAPSAVAIFALKDRAAAESWIGSELARTGLTATSQDYAGTTLYTMGPAAAGAYAFTDRDLLLGTVDGVKAAIDTKTKGSLADNANYVAAMSSLSGDSLARFYVDPKAMVGNAIDSYNSITQSMGGNGAPMPSLGLSAADVPAWIAGSVRAESDRMVVDVAMPRTVDSGSGNHVSRLASALPGSSLGVIEVHGIGKLVAQDLATLQAKLPGDASLKSVKDALALVGGLDWLGDGVAVVTKDGSTYGGGLVAEASDASTASAKVAMVGTLIALGGGSYHITGRHETYKGVDITVVTVPSNPVSNVGSVEIAIAAKDNLIVAGYTDAFVKAVIDTTPSTSLSAQPDYSTVMAAAGSNNEESFYVNVPALEDQIGQYVFADSPSRWTQDLKPYFDHFGGVGYAVVDGNTVILRFVVTAK